jgi:hypothetical protein
MNIQQLAETINNDCDDFEYFWAFGLLKETAPLWRIEENRNMLGEVAQAMFMDVEKSIDEQGE